MIWRFTILDSNNVATIIEEMVGWDNSTSEIKRDLDWHGIVFTNSGETFQFHRAAMHLLKAEYDQYGVEGDMTLVMEEDCGNGFEEFARGKFMFKNYEYVCGEECYVRVPIETSSETKDLRNRINQKVNLEAVKSFDETTDLPVYPALPFDMLLPSKGIFIKNEAVAESNIVERFMGGLQPVEQQTGFNYSTQQISLGFTKTIASEIGSFDVPISHFATAIRGANNGYGVQDPFFVYAPNLSNQSPIWPLTIDYAPIVNLYPNSPNYGQVSTPVDCSFSITGEIFILNCYIGDVHLFLLRLPNDRTNLTNGESLADYEIITVRNINLQNTSLFTVSGYKPPGDIITISETFNSQINLLDDDRLYFFMSVSEIKNQTQIDNANTNNVKAFEVTLNQNSFFKITNLSHTPDTISKVFAVNETISRIAESITNDKLRAYSEYFGRTDSQPYSLPADGCGGLEVITDGIRLRRQENRVLNKPSLFSLSLQDAFEGLNPIHNIGMGIEVDTNRAGFNRLRVEPCKYFYNDTIVLSCTNINKITRRTFEKEIFSTFQFGYAKWEAEEYTGLDEILTKRTYRTTLNQIKNDFVKLSKFIASGYALEITRRKGFNDSKDWRYDKESFIICVKRDGNGDLIVELGNVLSPVNIIDPPTLYNFRISPVRNAMRWMNKVLESYRQFNSDAKIIFTDGDANYYAQGEMSSADCKLENGVIAENETIDLTIYADPNNARPFLIPERILFDYPMTSQEYKIIETNPYGLIYFNSDCEDGYGWIDTINYKPEEGKATFNLIPKNI